MSRPRKCRGEASPLVELVRGRLSRRGLLGGLLASAVGWPDITRGAELPMVSLKRTPDEIMPGGYASQVIIAAGDPLLPGAPDYRPFNTDADVATMQFGMNNDFIAVLPQRPAGEESVDRAVLFANHEYPSPQLLWPDLEEETAGRRMSLEQVATTMAVVGCSVCEIERRDGLWRPRSGATLNRRITAATPMRLSGPAAGSAALRTSEDPTGTRVNGTLSNCNGGVTPWGTVLTCEEGAGWIFAGEASRVPGAAALARYYYDEPDNDRHGWSRIAPRFNLQREPNEPNRFEWVVEIDPYDPASMPVKRTALGRFAHEGAQVVLAPDGRAVVYLGDDWEFEYCYRFVSARPVDPVNRQANRDLLDDGVLSVAYFSADGMVEWRPLVFGQGPLTPEHGFRSQADVLVRTRQAADLVGATPMDAPEGFKPHPANGRIYLALSSNDEREVVDAANPRPRNRFGHMLELQPPVTADGTDHAATHFSWEVLVLCGDPADSGHAASFHPGTNEGDWFTDPDNLGFDPAGRMWVCTDGVQPSGHDGLYVMPVSGPNRARPQLFYAPPAGGECCSPVFNVDGTTLFLAIQHPGEGATTLADVETHWPDRRADMPPRSAVVALRHEEGMPIGGEFDF